MQKSLHHSDWFGILIGMALGVVQPFVIIEKAFGPEMNSNTLISVALFGLFAPPILAIVNKLFKTARSSFFEFIGNYVNTVFMMIAFGLSTGATGLVYHLAIGLPSNTLMPIVFFGAAGFGFVLAYFIYPDLAYRQKNT